MFRLVRGVLLVVIAIIIGVVILANTLDETDSSANVASENSEQDDQDTETETPVADPPEVVTVSPPVATPETTTTIARVIVFNPSEVRVQVANATEVSGAAGRLTDILNTNNYLTLGPINAPDDLQGSEVSLIYYEPEYLDSATNIAEILGYTGTPRPLPDPSPLGTDDEIHIIVIIGNDGLAQAVG